MTDRRPMPKAAEIKRALRAAKAEGFDHVELVNTPEGLKIVAERRATKEQGREIAAPSWMAEAGIPMSEIAAVLGHRDSRTTKFSAIYWLKEAVPGSVTVSVVRRISIL